ncbi:MAG TPA: sigma-70 family RNA polymerase sigma factor [Blastocatellia bacterium]|nr:sigma-70 family RNA polymerase sigma factor [Blastocatellia bacterium]
MTSENELIRLAQSGDGEAFCQLARRYERRIFSLALHYCRSAHDAEDLSQEAWLKAYRSLRSFRGEASFYTWVRQITINTFLNYKRRTKMLDKEVIPTDAEGLEHPHARSVEESLNDKILVEKVMQALGELTSQQRLIFLLKHREGMTYDEIAASLGCSAGTVKKSLFRAVLKLRERLGISAEADSYAPFVTGEGC